MFAVRLPAARATAAESAKQAEVVRRAVAPMQILLVDDNEDAAEMLADLLSNLGHSVAVAHDAETAVTMAEATDPDVAVLDIGLPDVDGYQLGAQLRAEHEGIYLIALTGYSGDTDRARSVASGFAHHLVKPVSVDRLLAALAGFRA